MEEAKKSRVIESESVESGPIAVLRQFGLLARGKKTVDLSGMQSGVAIDYDIPIKEEITAMKEASMCRSFKAHGETGSRPVKPSLEKPDAGNLRVRGGEGLGRRFPGLLGNQSVLVAKLVLIGQLVVCACAALPVMAGLQGDFDPKTICPSREVETPHVKWLTPSAEGPLKALFIVPQDRMREVVELAQRMDLDYRMATVENFFKHFESGTLVLPPLKAGDLRGDFQEKIDSDLDLIVVSVPGWKDLSYMQRYRILKKVKNGTPLLTFADGADEYLKKAVTNKVGEVRSWLIPWKGLPAFTNFAGTAAFQAGTLDKAVFGKGDIYLLKGYRTGAPQALTPLRKIEDPLILNPAEYDYYLAMIIHAMRSAARKTGPVEVKGRDYLSMERDNPAPVEFTVDSKGSRDVVLRFALRTRTGEVLMERRQSMKVKSVENKAAFEIGKIPAGGYFADLWVLDGEKILDFGSLYVEMNGSQTIAGVEIKPAIHSGEGISGKILLNVDPQTEGLTLKISQRDNFGRITVEKSVPVTREMHESKEAAFALPATTPLTIIQYVDAELRRNEDVLDRKSKGFSVSDLPDGDDVSFIVWWGGCNNASYLSHYFFRNLYNSGFDTHYCGINYSAILANMRHIPYATRLTDTPADMYAATKSRRKAANVREPCLTDPEYLKKEGEKLVRIAEGESPFGATVFSLGDECFFVSGGDELCFSPTCTAAFHEFLKKEYGAIENLNMEYGTEFKSFDEIKPITLGEARKSPGLMPLWADFRRHMESTWAGMLAFCGDAVRKAIPNARVGYEGTDWDNINSIQGFDWRKIMNSIRLNNTYDGIFAPYAVVDMSRPGTMLGTGWYGGYEEYKKYNDWDSRAYNQYICWRHLFRGANSFWVWMASIGNGGYGNGSVSAPDFSYLECFAPNLAEMREIKSGTGKLLMNAKREYDRTAILYSAPSVHAATLSGGPIQGVLHSLIPLMEDTRRQFKIISYEQLAEGILEKDGYKFLILPHAQSLSKKEVENIKSFVSNGGTVIADVRPGICDEHCKAYEKGALDDVFGVIHNTCVTQSLERVTMSFGDVASIEKLNVLVDPALKLQAGKAGAKAGAAPALIMNEYGKGKAVLMNFTLHEYQRTGDVLSIEVECPSKQAPEMRAVFEHVLNLAGIGPKIRLEPELSGLRAYRYRAGDLRYVGFLQHPCRARAAQFGEIESYKKTFNRTQIPSPVKTTAALDGKYHVYDIRRGRYLGYTDKIPMEVGPGRAEFYSLLPYKVKGLEINVSGRIRQGEILEWNARLKTGGGKAGLHIFRITLVSPHGKEVACYSANVKAEQGRASGKIAMAFNDEPGAWTLRIKDAASGQTSDAGFKVDPPGKSWNARLFFGQLKKLMQRR